MKRIKMRVIKAGDRIGGKVLKHKRVSLQFLRDDVVLVLMEYKKDYLHGVRLTWTGSRFRVSQEKFR